MSATTAPLKSSWGREPLKLAQAAQPPQYQVPSFSQRGRQYLSAMEYGKSK